MLRDDLVKHIPCLSPVLQLLFHIHMENCPRGIKGLQRVLVHQRILKGYGIIRRKLGTVCIIRRIPFPARCPKRREPFPVKPGKTEGG